MNRRTPAIAVTARMATTGRFSRCSTVDTASGYRRRHRSEVTTRIGSQADRRGRVRPARLAVPRVDDVAGPGRPRVVPRRGAPAAAGGCRRARARMRPGNGVAARSPTAGATRASTSRPGSWRSLASGSRMPRSSRRDFTTIELPADAFDGVVAFFVFNHLPRAEHAPMFARVYSWLRPGGRFMLSLGASDTDDEVEEDWLGVPMFFAGFEPDVERARAPRRGVRVGALGDAERDRSRRTGGHVPLGDREEARDRPMTAIDEIVYLMEEAFSGVGIEETNESQSLLTNLRSVDEAMWRALPAGRSAHDRVDRAARRELHDHVRRVRVRRGRALVGRSVLAPLERRQRPDGCHASSGSRRCTGGSSTTCARSATTISRSCGRRTGASCARPVGCSPTMLQHDVYHAGEVNHLRSILAADDGWRWG